MKLHFQPVSSPEMDRQRKRGRSCRHDSAYFGSDLVPLANHKDCGEIKVDMMDILWGEPIVIDEKEVHDNGIYDTPEEVYVDDVYSYLREKEKEGKISPQFLSQQREIKERVRKIMVDWIVKVHYTLQLHPETLFLAINTMDRYGSIKTISRDVYQLVGIASILLCSKYEDVRPPEIEDFLQITNDAFTREQIIKMEYAILSGLKFDLSFPSPYQFLSLYLKLCSVDDSVQGACLFFLESSLMDVWFYDYRPSQLAAAAFFMGHKILQSPSTSITPWPQALEVYSGYPVGSVRKWAVDLNHHMARLLRSTSLKGIVKKYSTGEFRGVSGLSLPCDV